MVGADWSRQVLTLGLRISYSLGEDKYRKDEASGELHSTLADRSLHERYRVSARLSL